MEDLKPLNALEGVVYGYCKALKIPNWDRVWDELAELAADLEESTTLEFINTGLANMGLVPGQARPYLVTIRHDENQQIS